MMQNNNKGIRLKQHAQIIFFFLLRIFTDHVNSRQKIKSILKTIANPSPTNGERKHLDLNTQMFLLAINLFSTPV